MLPHSRPNKDPHGNSPFPHKGIPHFLTQASYGGIKVDSWEKTNTEDDEIGDDGAIEGAVGDDEAETEEFGGGWWSMVAYGQVDVLLVKRDEGIGFSKLATKFVQYQMKTIKFMIWRSIIRAKNLSEYR